MQACVKRASHQRFNLVIERLLISGAAEAAGADAPAQSFNLVIERLLISGLHRFLIMSSFREVSISLSSGFSFQASSVPRLCSRWFYSFNLVIERLLISGAYEIATVLALIEFQSRYRAASHFRKSAACLPGPSLLAFQSRYRAASHFR